jgi:hypothetical protein
MSLFVALGEVAINSPNGSRSKGALNWAQNGLGRSTKAHFGPVRPQFPPRLLLTRFLIYVCPRVQIPGGGWVQLHYPA